MSKNRKKKNISKIHKTGENNDTYPFLKGPAFADFMFVVVEFMCGFLQEDYSKSLFLSLLYISSGLQ